MDAHELYDKILRELPKDGRLTGIDDYKQIDLHYLISCGFIEGKSSETGGVYLMSISKEGMKFISEGGFAEQYRLKIQSEKDKQLERENLIVTTKNAKGAKLIAIISILIAALSLIVAVIALSKQA